MTVSGFTLMSRILGLVRDILIGRILGAGMISDAFFSGFRLPNMFRRIFGEGAFNAAFIPLFGKELVENGESEAHTFANRAFSLLAWTLLIGTIIALPGMRWIMAVFTPGFLEPADFIFPVVNPIGPSYLLTIPNSGWEFSWPWFWEMVKYPHGSEKFEITVALSRIMFSYLMCMALTACLSGILNTLKVFAAPAFAPVLLNLVLITALGFVIPFFGFQEDLVTCGVVLSWAVTISGFAQLALLWFSCAKKGYPIKLVRPMITPRIKKLLILMLPGIAAAGVQQINLAIGTQIASVQDTAISWLYFADRIFQLPLGMIGIAFSVVLLPEITRLVRKEDESGVTRSLHHGITFSMLITLPAMVAMFIIPQAIMRTLFENGEAFTANDSAAAAAALKGFAFGLPAYILIKVLQPAYFAREDTKRPMIMATVTVIVNIVGSLLLFPRYGHVGIAIATSISGWVNLLMLYWGIRGSVPLNGPVVQKLTRIIGASAIMGLGLVGAQIIASDFLISGTIERILSLTLIILAGVVTYGVAALLLKATSVTELKAGLKR